MNVLEMFTVYWNPKDYPNKFVVRRFLMSGAHPTPTPKEVIAVTLTLREARDKIPNGLHCLQGDDPYILEVWF